MGIVGRTGAGKSTLIASLFRLAPIEGTVAIDDVDTATVPLETLRSRISIIPQEPVLFNESVRYNLDPFKKVTDDELWNALSDVSICKDYVYEDNSLKGKRRAKNRTGQLFLHKCNVHILSPTDSSGLSILWKSYMVGI